METIFCPQCGAEATSDDFACPKCESILNESALESEPTSVVQALLSRSTRAIKVPPRPAPAPQGVAKAPVHAPLPPAKLIPHLKGGIGLALQPLPPLEAELVSLIDGRATVGEIAQRAKISVIEVMAIFQSEALAGAVDVSRRPLPAHLEEAAATVVETGARTAHDARTLPQGVPAAARQLQGSAPRPPAPRPPERSASAARAPVGSTPPAPTAAPLPKGLRLTAPSFEELRDGTSHKHVEANVGSTAPALAPRTDALAVTQPGFELPPLSLPEAEYGKPRSSAPKQERVLGVPDRTFRDVSADDDDETATGSEPSIDPRRSLGNEARAGARPLADDLPAPTGSRSSVQDADDQYLFQASASLSAEGRIVGSPAVDDDVTPPRPIPSPLVSRPDPDLTPVHGVPSAGLRPPPRAVAIPSAATPLMPVGGRELELSVPEDDEPLELAREVRARPAPSATPFSDTAWTDSVLEQANALEREGNVAGAVQVLERAIASAPRPAALFNRLGLVMVKRSELRQAAALLGKAVALDPSNPIYRRNAEKIAQLSGAAAAGSGEKDGKGRRDR